MGGDNDKADWIAAELGPFYNGEGLWQWLGFSEERLDALVGANDLIAIKTAEGPLLFPAFQFDDQGRLPQRLPELYQLLRQQMSATTAALWIHSGLPEWGSLTMADILRGGDPELVERVFFEARHDVWSREH